MHPIAKNTIKKVFILIGACGISDNLALIITAYIAPIISPIYNYIVYNIYLITKDLALLTITKTPTRIPSPNINNMVDSNIPVKTIAYMATIPDINTYTQNSIL